jgi:membrane protease YdiL (CAAX protease family)
MRSGYFYNAPPFVKLIFVPALMGASYLFIFFLSVLLGSILFKVSYNDVLGILQEDQYMEHIGFLKLLQIFYSIGLFLVPGILAGFFIQGNSFTYILAHRRPSVVTTVIVVLLLLVAIPFINFLIELNLGLTLPDTLAGIEERIRKSEQDAQDMMSAFLSAKSLLGFLVNLFMIAIIPALGEEFLFRGVIQRIFTEWFKNHHLAILISAVLFSIMHFQFLGFLPRMVLGVGFGYMFVWSGSIWIPVLAHFINNAVAVVFVYLYSDGIIRYDLDMVGSTSETLIYTGFSTLAIAVMLTAIYYHERRRFN